MEQPNPTRLDRLIVSAQRALATWAPALCLLAGLAAIGYCAAFAGVSIFYRLARTAPQSPWDAAVLVEGWRAAQGLPVYEPQVSGHATLMYGPAHSYLLGLLFKIGPLSKQVPQLLSLASALGLVVLCVLTLRPYLTAGASAFAALTFFSIENRIQYFTDSRPDMIAWLLGLSGLVCMYLYFADRSDRPPSRYYWAGLLLLVGGSAFKQPVAMLAAVPPAALLLQDKASWTTRNLLQSLGPLACILAMFVSIFVFAKDVHYYTITVPRGWPIIWKDWPKTMWATLAGAPCLWYAIAFTLAKGTSFDAEPRRRLAWWLALLIIALPVSVLTAVKIGGGANSLLPAWVAILGLSWQLLATRITNRLQIAIFSVCCALTMLPSLPFIGSVFGAHAAKIEQENLKYREVINYVKTLDGVIYAPEDPAIVLLAKRTATRSFYVEFDALMKVWPFPIPEFLRAEIAKADHIVDVVNTSSPWPDVLGRADFETLGFAPLWSNGSYQVWKRKY